MATALKKSKKVEVVPQLPMADLILGVLLLFLVGSVVVYLVPLMPSSTLSVFNRVGGVTFYDIAALILCTALTTIYLSYFRTKLFFSTRWLAAASIYNCLILFVKFTVSSAEVANRTVMSFGSLLVTALLVSLLYIAALFVLYLLFDGRLLNKSLHKALIVSSEGKILLAMGMFVCVTLARILVFRLPVLSGTSAAGYLGDVFKANNALLSALLFLMIVGAVEAFAQVRRREDLKPFFITALGLILSFHLWWALFIYRGYS